MSCIEKFWRDATAADVTRVMNGETVEARFRDCAVDRWIGKSSLGGWAKNSLLPWLDENRSSWKFCQVYSPPQWYVNKPEPGEEYRLLEKFPDEAVQGGDFAFDRSMGWTELKSGCNETQSEGIWYRRKIEPPKQEPKFAVGQRVKIIGPKRTEKVRYNWEQGMGNQVGKTGVVTGSHDGSFGRLYQLSGIVEWNFQEDYLEPVVEPEPKHYTLQVGDSVSTPAGHLIEVIGSGVDVKHYKGRIGDTISAPNGRKAIVTEHGIEVT